MRLNPRDTPGFDEEHYMSLDSHQKKVYTTKLRFSDEERKGWMSKGGKAQVPKGFAKLHKQELREISARGGRGSDEDV